MGSTPITVAKRGGSTIGVVSRLENGVGASLESSNPSPSATIPTMGGPGHSDTIKVERHTDTLNLVGTNVRASCPSCPALVKTFEWKISSRNGWQLACTFGCMLRSLREAKRREGVFKT